MFSSWKWMDGSETYRRKLKKDWKQRLDKQRIIERRMTFDAMNKSLMCFVRASFLYYSSLACFARSTLKRFLSVSSEPRSSQQQAYYRLAWNIAYRTSVRRDTGSNQSLRGTCEGGENSSTKPLRGKIVCRDSSVCETWSTENRPHHFHHLIENLNFNLWLYSRCHTHTHTNTPDGFVVSVLE